MKKNIVFIICDALTQKNIDFILENQNSFPGFSKLLSKSEIFNNFFSCAPVTEMVLPSIFSGSYPLDQGGYEEGMKNKKNNFFKILSDNGYFLKILSASSWLSNIYNYAENKKTIEHLFSIENAWQSFQKAYLSHIKNEIDSKYINEKYLLNVIEKHFIFFIEKIENEESFFSKNILKINKNNKVKIINNINLHLNAFKLDPKKYLLNNIDDMLKKNFIEFFFKSNLNLFFYKLFNKIFGKNKKSEIPNIYFSNLNFEIRSPSQKCFADVFFKKLETFFNIQNNKPKACFLHFFDVHDRNFSSNQIFKFLNVKKIYQFKELKKKFTDTRKLLSILYIDNFLTKFFEKKLLKNTLFIFTSDHGTTFRGDESSLNSSTLTGSFHDDYINIPFIILNDGAKNLNNKLGCSVDILPILLDKMEILKVNKNQNSDNISFKPKSISDFVILEHCHRGPCSINLKKKIIYHCIRSHKFKYIHKLNSHPKDPKKEIKEVFIDLIKDKNEEINLINDIKYIEMINFFRTIVKKRIREILKD